MNAAQLTEAVTHTVLYFRTDGGEYVNTVTGAKGKSGRMTLDCGHTCNWRPLGDNMHHPRRGDQQMCGVCLDAVLDLPATT